jgi:hypothetical protein
MQNLGFIPSWQFDVKPFPSTAGPSLGFIPSWQFNGLGHLGVEPIDTLNAVFDSFWWRNRKWIALGAVAALGLGVLGGLTAIAR